MDGSSSSVMATVGRVKCPLQSFIDDKLREPKRGLGIAKLEQMRAEKAMKEYLQDPFSRTHISGPGIGIQGMARMDGSSTRDGNHGNCKRPAPSFTDKLMREPKRVLGVAKLEKMRAEEAMKDLKDPFSQAHFFGPAIGIQGMMSYPHGTGENTSGLFIVPLASWRGISCHSKQHRANCPTRPPSTSGAAASHVNPSNTAEPTTLQLFPDHMEDDEHADSKREGDHNNLPLEPASQNFDGHQDLDLELKL